MGGWMDGWMNERNEHEGVLNEHMGSSDGCAT